MKIMPGIYIIDLALFVFKYVNTNWPRQRDLRRYPDLQIFSWVLGAFLERELHVSFPFMEGLS